MRIRLEAQLKETLEFTKTHGHHKQMVKEAKSLDSIAEIVCKFAACQSAARKHKAEAPPAI